MTVERGNFSCKLPAKNLPISDREAAMRNSPHIIPWTSSMVENLIVGKVEDEQIRKIIIKKLKNCPDGALDAFVNKLDVKIHEATVEISSRNSKPKKKNLTEAPKEVSVTDLLDIRNSLSTEQEEQNEN